MQESEDELDRSSIFQPRKLKAGHTCELCEEAQPNQGRQDQEEAKQGEAWRDMLRRFVEQEEDRKVFSGASQEELILMITELRERVRRLKGEAQVKEHDSEQSSVGSKRSRE